MIPDRVKSSYYFVGRPGAIHLLCRGKIYFISKRFVSLMIRFSVYFIYKKREGCAHIQSCSSADRKILKMD